MIRHFHISSLAEPKQMKAKIAIYYFTFAGLLLINTACELNIESTVSTEQTLTALKQSSQSTTIFKDVFNEINNTARYVDDSINDRNDAEPVVKDPFPSLSIEPFDATSWPKTIILDYGPVNHLCSDMRERRGKLIIEATDLYSNQACEITTQFENFYQDNYKVEGKHTITYTGDNEQGFPVFDISVENGMIYAPDAKAYSFEQNTQREWVEGSETLLNYEDDVYLLTGEQDGYSSDSIKYDIEIRNDSPLDIWVKCRWVRAGIIDIKIKDVPDVTLDFGEGECDNYATASFNGNEYLINME